MPSYRCVTNVSIGKRMYAKGAVVDLDGEAVARLVELGAVAPADQTTDASSDVVGGDGDAGSDPAKPPAQAESKAAFVAYAVDHLGLDRDGAEAMSKAELIELTRQ